MMSYEEAISNLEYLISGCCTDTQLDYIEEIEMAIDALEKQIPMEPEAYGIGGHWELICPSCKENHVNGKKYCDKCGQRIKTGEDDE